MPTLILTGDQFLMSVRDMYVERLSLWTSKEFGLMFQVTMVIISFLTNILVDLLSEDCNAGDIGQPTYVDAQERLAMEKIQFKS